jgi:hypothetical protein
MKRGLLLIAIGSVVVSGPRPATADPTRGPFQVMRPDGTVVRISGEAAQEWWTDYHKSRYVNGGPRHAAELLHTVENSLGRFHEVPRYLILVESLGRSWPRAWAFYPSTDETPAYVVHPGGIGSGVAPLRWDTWQRATPRMERIILEATPGTPSPARARAGETSGRATAPTAWIAAAVMITALLIGRAVFRRRSSRSPEGRRGVERLDIAGRDRR